MRITCTWCRLRTCCYYGSQQSQVSLHKIDATASSLAMLSKVESRVVCSSTTHYITFFIVSSNLTRVDLVFQTKKKTERVKQRCSHVITHKTIFHDSTIFTLYVAISFSATTSTALQLRFLLFRFVNRHSSL